MDEILCANFMVFHDVVREERYDLWIGDEAWELDYYLHENPREKHAPFAWLTDFVGWLPMPDGGEREAFVDGGLQRRDGRAHPRPPGGPRPGDLRRQPRRHRRPSGSATELPMIRDWTERNFDFAGYVTGFDHASPARPRASCAQSSATGRTSRCAS